MSELQNSKIWNYSWIGCNGRSGWYYPEVMQGEQRSRIIEEN